MTNRYEVTAVDRSSNQDPKPQVRYVIEATGSKAAWQEARRAAKDGDEVRMYDTDQLEALPARRYTVTSVLRMDKPSRQPKPVTARELFDRAEERGVTVAKKLRAALEEMEAERGITAEVDAEEPATDQDPGTAAQDTGGNAAGADEPVADDQQAA